MVSMEERVHSAPVADLDDFEMKCMQVCAGDAESQAQVESSQQVMDGQAGVAKSYFVRR